MEMFWLGYLFIGIIAGLLAGAIRKGSRSDFVGYIVLGLLGSIIGGSIFKSYSAAPGLGLFAAAAAGAAFLIGLIEITGKN
ncbi:MAG: hypothetical protein M0Z79_03290 [Nitrospiraceae bacterium]|nr:hypothetical protein [Nitrospiraceae bacterium]